MISRIDFREIQWKRQKHPRQCRVYKGLFLRYRSRKTFTRTLQKSLLKLVKITMESWHKHASSLRNGTEWQKEPSAECKKEQLSHQCKVDYQTNGETVRWNAVLTCATCTTKWPMARQHSRKDMVDIWRTTNPLRNMGWVHPNYGEGQVKNPSLWTKNVEGNILRLRATCGGRFVRWLDDSRLWRFERIRSRRNLCRFKYQEIFEQEHYECFRAQTELYDFVVQDHHQQWRETLSKKKATKMVREWRIHVSTSWWTSLEALRRDKTNSDEYKQCLCK